MRQLLSLDPEVAAALARGQAVVAFESTVIAHGLPYPLNLATARDLEQIARAAGAVPATIAVLDGRIRVGLTAAELERLASGPPVPKLSRRDLPFALARGGDGATTVAATLLAAALAGIPVFATGGIGGVHRGAVDAEANLDISADLDELARTPVTLVCAGAKAILDLPRTLEYLDTRGVAIVGYGTDTFPAFYTRSSGLPLSHRLDHPEEVARAIRIQSQLTGGGLLVTVPIPEADALDPAVIDQAILQALREATQAAVTGAAVTPFLLKRLGDLTGGQSTTANIALLRNNARVAAAIAVALAAEGAAAGAAS